MSDPSSLPSGYTFHLIPHTHWDREWYLTRAEFQARLVPVLDGVLEQLEAHPDARFLLDGQTVLLEDYLALRPGQEARIRAQVTRGALEVGPWYILSDLLIPSAESLRQNVLEGRRQAEQFGGTLDVLYSPDAFGHPAALPAIAAELGFRRAVLRRGVGRPGDFYRWEASTGETLLVYQLPRSGYDGAIGLVRENADLAREWRLIRHELVERATSRHIAVFLGADHHAMARDTPALRDRLQGLEPDHPVRISGLGEFFDAVEEDPPAAPLLRGPLRRSRGLALDLQDVHSARARMKRRHSVAELRLSRIAAPLASQAGGAERNAIMAHAWRLLLQSQFHDTLAGTTCDEAQAEQAVRLAAVETLSRAIAAGAVRELGPTPSEPALSLWNPSRRERGGIVTAALTFFRSDVVIGPPLGGRARTGPGYQPFGLAPPDGVGRPVQVLAVRREQERRDHPARYPDQDEVDRVWVAFEAPLIPGLGLQLLHPAPAGRTLTGAPLVTGPGTLRNALVMTQIAPTGTLTLTALDSGASLDRLLELVDEPDRGDLYTFSPAGKPAPGRLLPEGQSNLAAGSLVGAVETRWTAEFRSGIARIRSVAVLHRDSPVLRLRYDLEHWGHDHRLRLRFRAGRGRVMAGATLGTDAPTPRSGTEDPGGIEREVATAPAQRWVAAVTAGCVLAVFTPGFFEYEWTGRGDLYVTVLRAVGELSRGDLPERPGHVAWPTPTPFAQELGPHRLELGLALVPPDAPDLPARLEELWEDAFLPIQAFYARGE